MALSIRMARAGAKKRPFYRIVVANRASPRDGRFIERLGTYNPLLPKGEKSTDHRVQLNDERIKHWLAQGAQPSERVRRFLSDAGLMEWQPGNNPQKAKPRPKTLERLKAAAEAKKAAEEAAREAAEKAASSSDEATGEAAEAAPAEAKDEAAAEKPAEAKDEAAAEKPADGDDSSAKSPTASAPTAGADDKAEAKDGAADAGDKPADGDDPSAKSPTASPPTAGPDK